MQAMKRVEKLLKRDSKLLLTITKNIEMDEVFRKNKAYYCLN